MTASSGTAGNRDWSSLVTKNTVINLVGRAMPLFVAIFAIPVLVRGIGADKFGVLSLAWMLIGYFSLFDLGVGRALTKLVAESLGKGREDELPRLIWTSLLLMLLLGISSAVTIHIVSPWLIFEFLKIPDSLREESLQAFRLLAFCVPIVTITTGLRGILEAKQCFAVINIVGTTLGLFTYLGPALVLSFSNHLVPIVSVLIIGRLVAFLSYLVLCLRVLPSLRSIVVSRQAIGPVLRFGGWISVSNILSPLMDRLDRFLIGSQISITAVAYYATSYDAITRLWMIPGAIVGVMFPAFSRSYAQDFRLTARLFSRGLKSVLLLLFPVILVVIAFAKEGLQLWLGQEFARESFFVLQCLALGVFVNSISYLPATLLQGVGRPDSTAKLHLIELPFYLIFLWLLTDSLGIKGTAIAWLIRVVIDMILMFSIASRLVEGTSRIVQQMSLWITVSIIPMGLAMLPMGVTLSSIFLIVVFPLFFWFSWLYVLDSRERATMQSWIRVGLRLRPQDQL